MNLMIDAARRGRTWLAGAACALLASCAGVQQNAHFDPAKPHHTPSGFRNLDPDARMGQGFVRWQWERWRSRLAETPTSAPFVRDIGDWSRICGNLYLWDYTVNFSHSVSPFPNLHVLAPNIRFFNAHGVRKHFQQANTGPGHEMSELKSYLLARLLWNPETDAEVIALAVNCIRAAGLENFVVRIGHIGVLKSLVQSEVKDEAIVADMLRMLDKEDFDALGEMFDAKALPRALFDKITAIAEIKGEVGSGSFSRRA